MGIIEILARMGARLKVVKKDIGAFEPVGNVEVEGSGLRGVKIGGEIIPKVIDELPIIMVAASLAEGQTVIEGARELRVKETDRISSMAQNLKALGAKILEKEDGVVIHGQKSLKGGRLRSFGDHRTAMSMVIAGLLAEGRTVVSDTDCIATSFPGFMDTLGQLI